MVNFLREIYYIVCAPILEDGKFSLGRWSLTMSLSLAMWKWAHNINITDSHQMIIIVLIGYVLGTKGLTTLQDAVSAYKEVKTGNGNGKHK